MPCYFWRISIASGPCKGWFIHQNAEATETGGESFFTQFTREPKGSDVRFNNLTGSVDLVNAFNGIYEDRRYFYQPFYENGWF